MFVSHVLFYRMGEAIELNVGGVNYATTLDTLISFKDSLVASYFEDKTNVRLPKDSHGRYFIDRDGVLFRYILDYMRNKRVILPENFSERERLQAEVSTCSLDFHYFQSSTWPSYWAL